LSSLRPKWPKRACFSPKCASAPRTATDCAQAFKLSATFNNSAEKAHALEHAVADWCRELKINLESAQREEKNTARQSTSIKRGAAKKVADLKRLVMRVEHVRRLVRHVDTRWDSEHASLSRLRLLWTPLEQLIRSRKTWKLDEYLLTATELKLADQLIKVLGPMLWVTKNFSSREPTLLANVLGTFEALEAAYIAVRNDTTYDKLIRYAVHQALIVLGTYYELTDDVPAYGICLCAFSRRSQI
jgi:hypothetical protein